MNCEEAKNSLADYWSQALSPADELAMEAHLGGCDTCRTEAERLGTLWRGLSLLPAEEPGPALRGRFYEALGAYRLGLESAPKHSWRSRLMALWPKEPAFQMAMSVALLVAGLGVGYGLHPSEKVEQPVVGSEISQLRGEVNGMRQLVTLSLLQQQSASERLKGVSWAYRVESSDTEVLSALLDTVNNDPNVNVRLSAVDALHTFGSSPITRTAILQAIPRQTTPMVQIALIDLTVDLKEKEATSELRHLADDTKVDSGVRQRAKRAVEQLQ